ncbi:MAG: CYTH domain-containing protein [Rhodoplanes sp.]
MAVEIERKFRVIDSAWMSSVTRKRGIRQAYLTKNGRVSVRIRIDGENKATLTIKTAQPGVSRQEYEYDIPVADAEELLELRDGAVIEKTRHDVPIGDVVWEIDVFAGENSGLVIAEVELVNDDQEFRRPSWVGEEITHDRRFYNADLAKRPFGSW